VFQNGGFDCILGNPPFLGGQKLSGKFGDNFLESIKHQFAPIGAVDLVTYFFRRIFTIINQNGFQSLISTNTIAQGKAREEGIEVIIKNEGTINYAVKSMKWPGIAAVEVSLLTITKQKWKGNFILNGKVVNTITSFLDDEETIGSPYQLMKNQGKSFQGSIPLGMGFVLEDKLAQTLVETNLKNKDVIFPYMNGDDLNNNPNEQATRYIINFFDWPQEKAKQYSECYSIVENLVKPERQRWSKDKNGNDIIGDYALRKPMPEKWWIYCEKRPNLYNAISSLSQTIVIARTSKTVAFTFADTKQVLNANLTIISIDSGLKVSDLKIFARSQ